MEKTARIFVAGHRGLLGSAVVRRLRREGYGHLLLRDRSALDLTDAAAVDTFFREVRPEYVVLTAGRVGGILENRTSPIDFLNVNLAIQLHVFRSAQQTDVQRTLFFGSSCMYPRECPQPMRETMLLSGKPEPTSLGYAVSKLAGIQMCLAYNQQYGYKRFIPLIPSSAYGPQDNFDLNSGHVLSVLIRRFHQARQRKAPAVVLWGSGNPRREFVYADDIAGACLYLLQEDLTRLDLPVNVGVGQDYSIRELAGTIAEIVGYPGRIEWDLSHPDGAPQKMLDSSRMLRLGWKPETDLAEGVRRTYAWYLSHGAACS